MKRVVNISDRYSASDMILIAVAIEDAEKAKDEGD